MEDNVLNITSKALTITFICPIRQQLFKTDITSINRRPDEERDCVKVMDSSPKVGMPLSLETSLSP